MQRRGMVHVCAAKSAPKWHNEMRAACCVQDCARKEGSDEGKMFTIFMLTCARIQRRLHVSAFY